MTHTYSLKGMTCSGCEADVRSRLLAHPDVLSVDVSREKQSVTIEMSAHIPLHALQESLGGSNGKFRISADHHNEMAEQAKGWLATYKPVLLIFAFITGLTLVTEFTHETFSGMRWMNHFMAGFFITFSFFKLLNLEGFAESYAMYDLLARKWNPWGYIYAFLELGLGIAFLTSFQPLLTNAVTLAVMSVSLAGVVKSLLGRHKIKCACLGDVFNLPVSTITVIEDALMVGMSAFMLVKLALDTPL